MRMSCNGCRVLRKGCSDDCILRPCLQWIASSDSQANATLFLAKFYGRAGLLNLIEAGPQHLRPSVFRSLLYEACGRIVNPVYGSVGMLWSGNWAQCQAAVDAVLRGSPIMHVPSPTSDESSAHLIISPPTACDIRHVRRDPNSPPEVVAEVMNRTGFKRAGAIRSNNTLVHLGETWPSDQLQNGDSGKDDESLFSVETVEGSLVKEPNPVWELKPPGDGDDVVEVALDLTLGLV